MKKGGRRKARIAAMEILYRADLLGDEIEDLVKEVQKRFALTGDALFYLLRLITEIKKNRKKIDRMIKKNLKDWKFSRLHLLDKAIMRVATCELLFFPDIPPKVAIDEAIEISKEYTDDSGRRFINAVLAAIYKEIENENRPHLGHSL
uniref:Transcription antitermination protein NusB n=1 Tax=candidate division WOR-3 bacterium TaxID=2052148 RepID=A0A7C3YSF6_UNCW3